jgi:hypothetical protein
VFSNALPLNFFSFVFIDCVYTPPRSGMEEAISFFRAFETWIYLLLGLWGLITVRKFLLAWQELRGATFGLERESAQSRLNQSASVLVLILTMAVTEFVLVSFIAPALPGSVSLPTPTLDLLATPSSTLPSGTQQVGELPPQATVDLAETLPAISAGCVPGQIQIVIPENGEDIRGIIPVVGTADIPNFGFYKFEIKRPDETAWLTIQAGNVPVDQGKLGDWDTTRLSPGDYQLALVVVDNLAQASDPCVVQVRVSRPIETPSGP